MPYTYENPMLVRTPECMMCNHIGLVKVETKDWVEYTQTPRAERRFIQDIFFYKDKADREQIMTGTHPKCFEEMFKESEEE